MRAVLVCAVLLGSGCLLESVDFATKRCPCAEGWTCDEARRVCVPGVARMDGGPGLDGGAPRDASAPVDAPIDAPVDAGSLDAGPTDAGPTDAGPPDAGPDPTFCDDGLEGVLFCDGFEEGPGFPAWTLGMAARDGAIERETGVVHRGEGALRAATTAGGGYAVLRAPIGAVTAGDLWFRAYYRLSGGWVASHFDLAYLRGVVSPYTGASFAVTESARPFIYLDESGVSYHSPVGFERDTWTCLEVHVLISDTAGRLALYLDGVQQVDRSGLDTSPPDGYAAVAVGVTWSNGSQVPLSLYIDEVAVGTARLPCDG